MISILIPCFNEKRYIEQCLRSVLAFDVPESQEIEILVIDGRSTDETRDIVGRFVNDDHRVKMLDNPNKIQSCALNLGIRQAEGEWIMRLDAHAQYPQDYLLRCYETALLYEADNVGGICITNPGGKGYSAQLVQALTTHRFGVGNSGFRTSAKPGKRDTVPFGFFRREIFDRIGYFDERLVRTQDYEFNRRLVTAGGNIYLNPLIQSSYFNQPSLKAFLKKQLLYQGPYNVYMWYLAPYAFTPRHAVTGCFALFFWINIALVPFFHLITLFFLGVMMLYLSLGGLASIQQAIRYGDPRHVVCMPASFFLFHLCHGTGELLGVVRLLCRTAPVLKIREPWGGAGKKRAWPLDQIDVQSLSKTL